MVNLTWYHVARVQTSQTGAKERGDMTARERRAYREWLAARQTELTIIALSYDELQIASAKRRLRALGATFIAYRAARNS